METINMEAFKQSVKKEKWDNAIRRMSADQPGMPGLMAFSEVSNYSVVILAFFNLKHLHG